MAYKIDDTRTFTISVETPPTPPSPPSEYATLLGNVYDIFNKPVANAEVSVNNLTVTTDTNGEYRIDNLPVGTVMVTVKHKDYMTKTQTVTLSEAGTYRLDIQLIPLLLLYAGGGLTAVVILVILLSALKPRPIYPPVYPYRW